MMPDLIKKLDTYFSNLSDKEFQMISDRVDKEGCPICGRSLSLEEAQDIMNKQATTIDDLRRELAGYKDYYE